MTSCSMGFFVYEFEWLAYSASLFAAIFGGFVIYLFYQRYQKKPSVLLKTVIYFLIFMILASVIDAVFFTINRLQPDWRAVFNFVNLGSMLSFSCNAVANIFLLRFTEGVFYENKTHPVRKTLYIGEALVIPPVLLSAFIDFDSTVFLLIHVVLSIAIYGILIFNSIKLRQRLLEQGQQEVQVQSLLFIAFSGLFILLALFSFLTKEVTNMLGYREFFSVALGWVFGAVAALFIYLGFFVPDWMKKEQKLEKK